MREASSQEIGLEVGPPHETDEDLACLPPLSGPREIASRPTAKQQCTLARPERQTEAGKEQAEVTRGWQGSPEGLGLPGGAGPGLAGLWLGDLRGAVGSSELVGGPRASGLCGLLQKGGNSQSHGKHFRHSPAHLAPGQAPASSFKEVGRCGGKGLLGHLDRQEGSVGVQDRAPASMTQLPPVEWEACSPGSWRVQGNAGGLVRGRRLLVLVTHQ